MNTERRRIFAFSGILKPEPGGPQSSALLDFAVGLAAAGRPVRRVCYIPTAIGDRQDAIDHYTTWFAERGGVEFSFLRLFTQPNVPDIRAHLLSQDVILVEGGSASAPLITPPGSLSQDCRTGILRLAETNGGWTECQTYDASTTSASPSRT